LVRDFTITFDVKQSEGDDIYKTMIHTKYDPLILNNYISNNSSILMHKIGNNFFFDFIYNKVIHEKGIHPNATEAWKTLLLNALNLVQLDRDYNFLRENKRYILDLQSDNKSFVAIFERLLELDFDIGDPEFLLYSIVARGELSKFKLLAKHYVIDEYYGILDVALRFGRYQIIEYFMTKMNMYGCVLDFVNYTENFRYLYYNQDILRTHVDPTMPAISCALQDYVKSLELILNNYAMPVTIKTIYVWCDLIRNKVYYWDKITYDIASVILEILRQKLDEPIHLSEDFGEFNSIIFGHWGERKFLVDRCQQLETNLLNLEERYAYWKD
jgi:hypothetical protein